MTEAISFPVDPTWTKICTYLGITSMAKIVRLPDELYGAICRSAPCDSYTCSDCVSRRSGYKITSRAYGNGVFVDSYPISHISATRKELLELALKWL